MFIAGPNDPFDTQFDHNLVLQTAAAIGRNKSRDLFQPITVEVDENKWKSNNMSKGYIDRQLFSEYPHPQKTDTCASKIAQGKMFEMEAG